MQKQQSPRIQMHIIEGQKEVNEFIAHGLKWLGFDVNVKVCSPPTAR